ncbi:MAG: hypothetical protein FWE40_01675 [Oscillospiraceae bacterium]|nr:hypothetical protein [Oscillospiraceae bacterium]
MKDTLRLAIRIIVPATAAVVVIWLLLGMGQLMDLHGGQRVTARAEFARVPVTITADMTFVREEIALPAAGAGVAALLVEPGQRVALQQNIAAISGTTQQAELRSRQTALQQRLRWLQDSDGALHLHALNVNELGRQVDDTMFDFMRALERGQLAELAMLQENFVQQATALDAALGVQIDFAAQIAQTRAELQTVQQQLAQEQFSYVRAPQTGAFYPQGDIWPALQPAELQTMTPNVFLAAQQTAPEPVQGIGRLVTAFRWYAATVLDLHTAQQLQAGNTYTITFPMQSAREFNMRLERINFDGDDALVVFSSTEQDRTLANLRHAQAEITLRHAQGLVIPAQALRFVPRGEGERERTVTAVYISHAGRLLLRQVDVLHQQDDELIVAWRNLNEWQRVEADRLRIEGHVQHIAQDGGRFTLLGHGLRLTPQWQNTAQVIPEGPAWFNGNARTLFDDSVFTGENLQWQQDGDAIVLTGENLQWREQRGAGLRIYDYVLVLGRIGEDDPYRLPD